MKIISILISAFFLNFYSSVFHFSEEYQVKIVPKSIVSNYYNNEIPPRRSDIYIISDNEMKGKNETMYIEKLLKSKKKVLLPNKVILIEERGINIPSNSSLYFNKNTVFKYKGLAKGRFSDIVKIYNVTGVYIYNAKIEGSKSMPQQSGEWSAGISILNSTNIKIENAHIYNTWGDGIFIGSEDNGVSKNISLKNVWIDNARRNAISITSVIGANIVNTLVSNTNGTLPECGVDIEPSLSGEYIQDVNFTNFYSYNNKNAAFNINLSTFNSNEFQYKPEVTININGIYDEFSYNYIGLGFNNHNWKYTPKGKVSIKNGSTKNNRHDIRLDLSNINTKINLVNEGLRK